MPLVLHGYRYSVYVRIVRLALAEKGVAYDRVEVNPFAPDVPAAYLALHPFGRLPTPAHADFPLHDTGPALQPSAPRALGRMDQIIGVVDSYGYWPLVRQVFSHRVFRPAIGQPADEAEIERGLAGATKVLAALEALAAPDAFLVGPALSLADLHLGAMIAYFAAAPEGAALLRNHPRLAAWWVRLSRRPSFAATDPGLPNA